MKMILSAMKMTMEEYKGKTIAVSGGFDPIHIGHVRLFKATKDMVGETGKLIVILNSDSWLIQKKGKYLMNENDRAEILRALSFVDDVFIWESTDHDVSGALHTIRPDIFANGGDRDQKDAADPTSSLYKDIETCKKLGIVVLFNLGGDKIRSSSELLTNYGRNKEKIKDVRRSGDMPR